MGRGDDIGMKRLVLRTEPFLAEDEANRLAVVEQLRLLKRGEDEPFGRVTRLTRQRLGVDTAMVPLINGDQQLFSGNAGNVRTQPAVATSETEYPLEVREVNDVIALASRLEDPVAKLGDVIRTAASLMEHPDPDPRLPRLADVTLDRLATVEALISDLSIVVQARRRRTGPVPIDVREVLDSAGKLLSAARANVLVLDLPTEPVIIKWPVGMMNRSLTLLMTTALHHLRPGGQVTVRLSTPGKEVRIEVRAPDTHLPVGQLLRVAGQFLGRDGEELPLAVSSRAGRTRVQNSLLTAASTSLGTQFEVRLPR